MNTRIISKTGSFFTVLFYNSFFTTSEAFKSREKGSHEKRGFLLKDQVCGKKSGFILEESLVLGIGEKRTHSEGMSI